MRSDAVRDASDIIHRVLGEPEPFTTMTGGIPGQTWCGTLFYDSELGPKSCSMAGMHHPYAKPMIQTKELVNCMTCMVRECQ